uniref:Uncharacterized protein n=2 Tax=Thermococcus sp. CIR10 TaxID=1197731 RepID=L0B8J0_9EURY|nr:hypothetical protein c10-14 [Thermococcus sp. CIR10]
MPGIKDEDKNVLPLSIRISPRLKKAMDRAIEVGLYDSIPDLVREAIQNYLILVASYYAVYKEYYDATTEIINTLAAGKDIKVIQTAIRKDPRIQRVYLKSLPFLEVIERYIVANETQSLEDLEKFATDIYYLFELDRKGLSLDALLGKEKNPIVDEVVDKLIQDIHKDKEERSSTSQLPNQEVPPSPEESPIEKDSPGGDSS